MESFTALCELKNFTKAADYLYLAQSSLSTQIKSLEEELGYKLVSRDNKKEVVLTKEGEIFLDFCRRCLSLYDQLQDSLDKSSKSTIKNIGLFYNPRLEMWADKISYHNTDCPNDKYGIVFSYGRERVEQMLKNEFFIAFSRRNPIFEDNGFTFSHSYDSCFALGVSYDHPLSILNEAVPDDFRNYTIYTIDPKRTNADIKLINLMVSKYNLDRLKDRLHETAYLNQGLTLVFRSHKKGAEETVTYHEPDGLKAYITALNAGKEPVTPIISFKGTSDNIECEVAFQFGADPLQLMLTVQLLAGIARAITPISIVMIVVAESVDVPPFKLVRFHLVPVCIIALLTMIFLLAITL